MPIHAAVDIMFNKDDWLSSRICTNMHRMKAEEKLKEWMRNPQNITFTERIRERHYTICIGIDLNTNTFYTESDVGDEILAKSIVNYLLQHFSRFSLSPLPESANEA